VVKVRPAVTELAPVAVAEAAAVDVADTVCTVVVADALPAVDVGAGVEAVSAAFAAIAAGAALLTSLAVNAVSGPGVAGELATMFTLGRDGTAVTEGPAP
jgi:hypothetical protein